VVELPPEGLKAGGGATPVAAPVQQLEEEPVQSRVHVRLHLFPFVLSGQHGRAETNLENRKQILMTAQKF
jgi:hypothetical protein